MQLELRRTNDAELLERKHTLMTRLGEELGEHPLRGGYDFLQTRVPSRYRSALFTMSFAA